MTPDDLEACATEWLEARDFGCPWPFAVWVWRVAVGCGTRLRPEARRVLLTGGGDIPAVQAQADADDCLSTVA